jgi:hypothetical protein
MSKNRDVNRSKDKDRRLVQLDLGDVFERC